jgi:sec-independent protein translocase protein TatA
VSIVHETLTTVAFGMPGGWEWIIIGVIGLLIFGRRLPEVGRSIGQGIVEFKKGLKGIQDDMDAATRDDGKKAQLSQNEGRPTLTPGQEQAADERRVSQAGGSA